MLEQLRGYVEATDFGGTQIAGDIVVGWQGVCGGEGDGLSDREGAQEVARLECPWLEKD